MAEDRALLSADARKALPSSAFAYIDEKGERHFPVHDKAHVIAALRLGPRSPMWAKAKGKVMAAARKFGVGTDSEDSGRSLESLFPEVRFIFDCPEVRSAEGEPQHILGYAAVFGKTSRRLGGFHEQVMPGAFDEALRSIEDGTRPDVPMNVVCRYNHKDDMVLGTTHAGTLKLRVDDRGLAYDVLPPNHRADVLELVERGDVRYSSFAFRVLEPGVDDTWGESEHGLPMRQLRKVGLVDVAPVLDPAYHDTNAMARNISGAVESLASWVGGDPAEVRSMLEAGQASRFFRSTRRSGQHVIPKPESQDRQESRVLDDPAISLRSTSYAEPEPVMGDSMVPEDERSIRDEEEIRAAMKPKSTDQLCMRFHHGEPCVRPSGHPADGDNAAEGGHAGLCWGRHDGLPCNQHMGHEGGHTPITVASRDGADAEPEPEKREGEPEVPNLSGPEAMRKMMDRRKTLTALPE
jgi:uncharacterized protein